MLKESSYQEKFQILNPWLSVIIGEIKKDLRNHLKEDVTFFKKYLPGKTLNKITNEELAQAYSEALALEGNEELAEFLANRWLLQHSDVYYSFEQRLRKISPDFDKIQQLEAEPAQSMMQEAVQEFGPIKTYIFSVLNSVVFPQEVFDKLGKMATEERHCKQKTKEEKTEKMAFEDMKREHELEIARLTNRYEKKILGLQKKYQIDVDSLKKQLSQLQRKLHG